MDFQQQFNQNLADENKTLKSDLDELKSRLAMKDKE